MSAKRILFLGNSYTHRGPLPLLLHRIAEAHDEGCLVYEVAPEAASLETHFQSDEVEYILRHGDWDVLVLQEKSTRAMRSLGDPSAYVRDVIGLYDLFRTHSPKGALCLMQTWARHLDHQRAFVSLGQGFYPKQIASPEVMLEELHEGVLQAQRAVAEHDATATTTIAWVGDAWRAYAQQGGTRRLHSDDGNHANVYGQWLSAVVLFETLFERSVERARLQEVPAELMAVMRKA